MKHKIILNSLILLLTAALLLSCEESTGPDNGGDPKPPGYQEEIPWPSLADSPWPIFRGDPQNTNRSNSVGPHAGIISQVYNNLKLSSGFAVDENSNLYVIDHPSSNMSLVCLGENGAENWRFNIEQGTGEFPSSPLLTSDSTIVLSSSAPDSAIYAVNRNGELEWKIEDIFINTTGSNIGKDGTLYFLEGYSVGGHELISVTNDGIIKWKTKELPIHGGDGGSFSFSPDGNTLYFSKGVVPTLTAFDVVNQTIKWSLNIGDGSISYPSVDSEGNIYLMIDENDLASLIKVDNTGNLLWRYDTQEDYATSIAIDKYGNLIFGSSTYGLHSVNNAGKLNWKLPITQDPKRRKNIHNAPVVDENSNIYVAVDSSELNEGATTIRKYSREGELIFKVQYPEKLYHKGGSLILGNNKLFCRTRSAKLLVIE